MDQRTQVKVLSELLNMREAKATSMAPGLRLQSTHVYVDDDHAAMEADRLFGQGLLIAGLAGEIPLPGDWFTMNLGRASVLVIRAEDGGIRAFLNACRHRGARIAEGRGSAGRVFRCPYHAWVYDLDGRLMGQPVAQHGFDELDNSRIGLVELPSAEASGFVLVGTKPGAAREDPGELFDGLAAELGSHRFDTWSLVGERAGRWPMNWKMPFETFLESYHIFALHKESLAKEVLATPMLSEFFGPHGRGLLTGRQAPRLREIPEDQWGFAGNANLVYWLFPNTVLSLPMTGHAELWQFYPGSGSGDCVVTTRFYVPDPPATDRERSFWGRMIDFTMGVVESEDFAQQEAIQRNVASGAFPQRIFGRNEPALIHFHESLDTALGASTAMSELAR